MASRVGRRQLEDAVTRIMQGLNVAQKAAVTSAAPVLQVLAPPGSGKTKTLTSRVAYLLAHEQYAPWNVICCTFTIKASKEMRERLRGMIGADLESRLILGTFHSVCRRYLVSYGHLIGLPKNFGVADSDDSLNIIKRVVKRLNLKVDPRVARSRISHRKARGKRLEDLPKSSLKNVEAHEFATIFQEYEDALTLSNLLDYDDLLMRCVDLLKQHPECVSNVEALLIDEFQDTNVVQFELMKLLASAKRRVTIVGDPDQSIYGFRSAEIENLRRMRAFYPDTVVINLEENYRSATAVLRLAQEIIEQDNDRPQKKLKSTHRYGTLPVLRRLPNPHEEAQWIASEIKRMTAMTGNMIQHDDIAILLRSAFLSLLIEKALTNSGIPYRLVGRRRFFDRVEIRVLLDYLRTISHPDNTSALLAIINTPTRKIGETTVKELTRMAELKKESLWSVCQKVLNGQFTLEKKLSKPAEQGLRDLVSMIQTARHNLNSLKPEDAPGKLIEFVVNKLDYKAYIAKQYPEDHGERWENVKELVTQASDSSLYFNSHDEDLPAIDDVQQEKASGAQEVLSRFLANVALSSEIEADDEEQQKPRVVISTIHSAKGLEWPVVFVPALYEGSIPHSRADDTNEERRLLYVAGTRAQALLYMTFPVMQSRDDSESILSQFLPPSTNPFISRTGPSFNDRVVEDIASVLRRPPPSQEAIAEGHCSIKENESQLDDLWPEDGSRRRAFVPSGADSMSFELQKGQSLADALRSNNLLNQKSSYSTLATSSKIATTMSNISAFSTSNMSMGFTTANQHLKLTPQSNIQEPPKPSLTKSASDSSSHMSKKPKLMKSASGQGDIAAFFGSSGLNRERKQDTALLPDIAQQRADKPGLYLAGAAAKVESAIPSTLSSHKLSYGTSLLGTRPRVALAEVTKKLDTDNKRSYSFLSSSPTRDNNATKSAIKSNRFEREDYIDVTKTLSASSKPVPVSTVCTKDAHNGNAPLLQQRSFQSGQMTRLGGLNPLNNMGGMRIGQGLELPRKTLGIRRSMNGWENRKNK